MKERVAIIIYFGVLLSLIALTWGALPGTFFWRPRVGLNLTTYRTVPDEPKVNVTSNASFPIVIIKGFRFATAILIFVESFKNDSVLKGVTTAHLYSNMYRWFLRWLNGLPDFIMGTDHYSKTMLLYTKRYIATADFPPRWLQLVLFWIPRDEWQMDRRRLVEFREVNNDFVPYYIFPYTNASLRPLIEFDRAYWTNRDTVPYSLKAGA